MSIERKKDEKGNLIFGVGNRDFSNQGEAEIKNNELEEEKAKKKKAEKTDLMKEVARLPKKDDKKNKTEVKGRS
ncbi:hypothetical protein HW276_11570 [Leptotrichia sp. oral taxon 417]|uniref:hypothetical protein n=1 Tax=Leptotrichia sp. oral taxon 417 TaxID=712365 RepID=UPI0015B8FE5D|nr:hypothetical protein [Leptotrichia sp. oral taxon 417]NWO28317.1 hypothetical protein [Leptotrichia sp. oral taxon 417]NWO28326.1 hypothetical protein [Leptotrichia sp. oral taxon 417]